MPMMDFLAGEEHEVTAVLAYRLWEKRGCPFGSPEVDWFEAKIQMDKALAKDDTTIAIFATGMEATEET